MRTYGKLNAFERSKLVPLHLKMQGFIAPGVHCAASVLYTSSQLASKTKNEAVMIAATTSSSPSPVTCFCSNRVQTTSTPKTVAR